MHMLSKEIWVTCMKSSDITCPVILGKLDAIAEAGGPTQQLANIVSCELGK